ncbi:MAG: polymerase subunit sigma-70 [Bacteroidetes bacterium]|nr:polymerase subunit sigma-70 [Bacteroidota bacterium]
MSMVTKTRHTEEELVEMLKQGNRHAFSVLYDNYSRALLGVIKKNISDDEIAEDVLQDSFIKIWNNRLMYNASKGRLYTWMLNIVRNTSIDYLRSKQNKMDEKIQRGDNTVHEVNRLNNTEQNTDRIGIKKIVDELKEDQRRLIDLAYFEGYTQEEIAEKLSIPLGTVKTRMRAALMVLRKLIR